MLILETLSIKWTVAELPSYRYRKPERVCMSLGLPKTEF